MTTLEELNQREAEEIQLVREKYQQLRRMVQARCEHVRREVDAMHVWFGSVTYVYDDCRHCGADMAAKEKSR